MLTPSCVLGKPMRRRDFITGITGSAAAWPLAARGQQSRQVRRIGILMPYPKSDAESQSYVRAFRQELARLGWSEDGNVQFDERWSTSNMDLVRADAASLVALNPDVIVVVGDRVIPILTISGPHRGPARKKEGSGPSMRGDQLIDRGAIITGEYWVCMRPELGEFIQ